MSDHAARKTITAYFAAVSMLDAPAFAGTFHPKGETTDPMGTPPKRGRAEIHQWFSSLASLFQEVSMEPARVFVCGSHAAVQWNARGTGRNGRHVQFAGITSFELDEPGSIVHARGYWDPEPVLGELTKPAASPGH